MTAGRIRKTRLVRDVESQQKKGPIETWLPSLVETLGFEEAANRLGVSKGSIQNWIGQLGLKVEQERRLVPMSGGEGDVGSSG